MIVSLEDKSVIPKKSIFWMILLTVITGIKSFLYPTYWIWRRVKLFNDISENIKISKKYIQILLILSILAFIFLLIIGIINGYATYLTESTPVGNLSNDTLISDNVIESIEVLFIAQILSLISDILTFIVFINIGLISIQINRLLSQAYPDYFSKEAYMKPFLFNVFYLQYKINKLNNENRSDSLVNKAQTKNVDNKKSINRSYGRYIGLLSLILLLGGLFYWYESRPSRIRHDCSWVKHQSDEVLAKEGFTEEEIKELGILEVCPTAIPYEKIVDYYYNNEAYFDCTESNEKIVNDYKQKEYQPAKVWYTKATDKQYEFCLRDKGLEQ